MKVLFVCPNFPYPLTNGGRIRIYSLAKRIAKHHELRLFSLVDAEFREEDRRALDTFCAETRAFPNRARRAPNAVLGLAGRPFALRNYWSDDLDAAIEEAARDVDILHFHCLHTAQYARRAWPCIFDSQNVDRILWMRRAATARNPIERWYCRRQADRLAVWEQCVVRQSRCVLACSAEDAAQLSSEAVVVPNGVDTTRRVAREPVRGEFVYMGDMSWHPNIEAVASFCAETLPQLAARLPEAHLTILGDRPVPAVFALAGDRVAVTGRVESVEPFLAKAEALVVPLKCGSGTRLKILEAMALGVPVVSTPIGCEGLGAVDGEHLLVADSADAMAMACLRIANDLHFAANLAANARQLVESRYDWDAIAAQVETVYARLASEA